jgi:hypothetical protein
MSAPASNAILASSPPTSGVLKSARINLSGNSSRTARIASRPAALQSGVPISMMSTSGATFKDMARAGHNEM